MTTIVKFDDEHGITVEEDLHEVEDALLNAAADRDPPLARLTRASNKQPVLVNAGHVRLVIERNPARVNGRIIATDRRGAIGHG